MGNAEPSGRKHGEKRREALLLDFHLDQLSNEDRNWVESELLRDAELRTKSDRLRKILRPLDHWTVSPAPTHLVERVLRSVEASPAEGTAAPAGSGAGEAYRPRPFFSLRELVAIAASIVVLVSVAVPGLTGVRNRAQRAACASNLGSIFRGVTLYQQAFGGSLPFAGSVPDAAWLPEGARNRPYVSNSRHPYLIAKLSYAKPEDFVCPASKAGTAMRADELADYDDFARARNISYDSLNLAGGRPNLRPPRFIAYMSDANPLFADARFNPSVDPTKANSRAHGRGAGQSVLILNGSVRWLTSPVYGVKRDNLWIAGNILRYVGTETPAGNEDAFLIPGYPATERRRSSRPLH